MSEVCSLSFLFHVKNRPEQRLYGDFLIGVISVGAHFGSYATTFWLYNTHAYFYNSNCVYFSSKLHAVLDTMAELLRSEREAESAMKCQLSFQNIITVLSHKLDIAKSLIEKKGLTPESFEWRHHILYAMDSNSIYNSVQKDRNQQSNNRLSVDYNRMSMASFRGSITSIYSSHHSLRAGSSNALVTNGKLQGSTHSLVASSKSLLSSRNALLAATGGSDLQKSGTSSLVLYREPQPPMKCFVHCGESILPYGFEYHGPKAKLVLSPVSESCMLAMMNELARFTVPSLRGVPLSGKTETGLEVARVKININIMYCIANRT